MARTKAEGGISGLQKAAILLIALGPERSAGIFKHLKEEEIEELTLEIANTRSVTPQQYQHGDTPYESIDGTVHIRNELYHIHSPPLFSGKRKSADTRRCPR